MTTPPIELIPIGHVCTAETQTRLAIDPAFIPGLRGLGEFTHLQVLYWCHQIAAQDRRQALVCEKPYVKGPDKIGVLATRSPVRPNPIGLTAVRILDVDAPRGIIQVPYIDAANGTPIIDLKPYHPCLDRIREVAVPPWCDHWPEWYEDSATFDWEAEFCFGE